MIKLANQLCYSWKNQESQHPEKDTPGIHHRKVRRKVKYDIPETEIDILLYYSQTGILKGILYYYGVGCYPEDPGNINLYVRPANRRKGIGSLLLLRANDLWLINWEQQTYTQEGLSLCKQLGFISESL